MSIFINIFGHLFTGGSCLTEFFTFFTGLMQRGLTLVGNSSMCFLFLFFCWLYLSARLRFMFSGHPGRLPVTRHGFRRTQNTCPTVSASGSASQVHFWLLGCDLIPKFDAIVNNQALVLIFRILRFCISAYSSLFFWVRIIRVSVILCRTPNSSPHCFVIRFIPIWLGAVAQNPPTGFIVRGTSLTSTRYSNSLLTFSITRSCDQVVRAKWLWYYFCIDFRGFWSYDSTVRFFFLKL